MRLKGEKKSQLENLIEIGGLGFVPNVFLVILRQSLNFASFLFLLLDYPRYAGTLDHPRHKVLVIVVLKAANSQNIVLSILNNQRFKRLNIGPYRYTARRCELRCTVNLAVHAPVTKSLGTVCDTEEMLVEQVGIYEALTISFLGHPK